MWHALCHVDYGAVRRLMNKYIKFNQNSLYDFISRMNVDKFNGVRGIMVSEAPGRADEVVIMISGAPHQTPDARSCPTHAAPPAIFTSAHFEWKLTMVTNQMT